MYASLNAGLIGIHLPPPETVTLASRFGFAGVDLDIPRVLDVAALRGHMQASEVRPGLARGLLTPKTASPDAEWDAAMAALPRRAEAAAALGFTRTYSVVLPFHDELAPDENRALHVRRLRQAAPILADHGIRIGLEYVSEKTRRAGHTYPFAFNLEQLLQVIVEADQPNVGVMLDSLHWHCAAEDGDAIRALTNEQVVFAHVNDAVAGRSRDEQLASERELPCATGEIDLATFMQSLAAIGYDGPVAAEPMNQALNAMPDAEKLATLRQAMDRLFSLLG